MGVDGRSAATALQAAAEANAQRTAEILGNRQPDDETDNSGRVLAAAEYMTVAVWQVTHDVDRFLHLVEKTGATVQAHDLFPNLPEQFSSDEDRLLKAMLKNTDSDLRVTALQAIAGRGTSDQELRRLVIGLLDDRNADQVGRTVQALVGIGPGIAAEVEPKLNALYAEGTISTEEFAQAIAGLKIQSPQFRSALEAGLALGPRTAVACVRALPYATDDPERAASVIIDAVKENKLDDRDAISVLKELSKASDTVIPYLIDQRSSSDYWTRYEAIDALGAFGAKSAAATVKLKKYLNDKSAGMRIQAAKSILLVRNDAGPFEQEMKDCLAGPDERNRYLAFEALKELKSAGAPYLHFVTDALPAARDSLEEDLIETLGAIGTPEALAVLEREATSKDWLRRSRAAAEIHRIQHATKSGGQ